MALGAGLILAAAFPPLGLWWTAPIALAALNLLVAERGMWAGAGLGLVFGLGLFAPLLHFAAVAMGNAVGWAALTAVESLYLAALGAAWALVSRLPAVEEGPRAVLWRVTAFALLWCGAEELRSSWPWGGLPFGRIAFAMADSPVLPFAAYGGSIGVGLLVALSGGCLAELVAQSRRRALVPGLAAAAAAGTLLLSPLVLPVESAPQDGAVRVAAVQGNVAENFEDAFERALEVTGNHAEATEQLAARVGPGSLDVVVWPENAADLDPRDHPRTAALVALATPMLVIAMKIRSESPGPVIHAQNRSAEQRSLGPLLIIGSRIVLQRVPFCFCAEGARFPLGVVSSPCRAGAERRRDGPQDTPGPCRWRGPRTAAYRRPRRARRWTGRPRSCPSRPWEW